VLDPLDMGGTRLDGRPAEGLGGPAADLAAFAHELLRPRVLPVGLLAEATSVAFPGLRGVLPGFGLQDPNDWGLGVEVRGRKSPHWTGRGNSPATFGHFGRSGTFLWVDPVAGLALACLTDRPFGAWAVDAWPALSDAVLAAARSASRA
jgi:CubicO group peptidase (beta-lactamase class C family)